jgi:hypothetical protein
MLGFAVLIPRQLAADTRQDMRMKGGLRSVHQHPGPKGTTSGSIEPVIRLELERIEALELLGMTLVHLNDAEARVETSPRVPLLMALRDKLALGLREEQ